MRTLLILVLFILLCSRGYTNNLALPCYGCHGPEGNSSNGSIPSIAGLNKNYFIQTFKEYKNKTRENYLMHIIAKGYSEIQIEKLAIFFSARKKQ